MQLLNTIRTLLALTIVSLIFLMGDAHAATNTWTGFAGTCGFTGGCDWNDPVNWSLNRVPEADDDVIISIDQSPEDGTAAVVGGAPTITLKSLTLQSPAPSLSDTELSGSGTITVKETFTWTDARLRVNVNIPVGATMAVTGTGNSEVAPIPRLYFGATLTNAGIATWSGAGDLRIEDGAVINNIGTFIVQNNSTMFSGANNSFSEFNNNGTLTKTSSGTTVIDRVNFHNNSTVDVQSGTLQLAQSGQSYHGASNGSTFTGAGRTLVLGSGALTAFEINGTVNLGSTHTFESSISADGDSELLGTGTFAGGGTFKWSGGEISANLTIANGTKWLISGTGEKTLQPLDGVTNSGTITNLGAATWMETGEISNGGIINNTGTFLVQNNATMYSRANNSFSEFNNNGTLTKTSSDTTVIDRVNFHNNSTVEVQSGTLQLAQNGEPRHSAGNDSTFTGAGRTLVLGGILVINGTVNLGSTHTFESSSNINTGGDSELLGTGTFAGGGTFKWSGGVISANLTVANGTNLLIDGTGVKYLQVLDGVPNSGILTNLGTANWSGSDIFGGNGTLRNQGTLNINGTATDAVSLGGDFVQTSTGILNMDIGSATVGSGYDQLAVGGTATLAGTMNVNFINGFVPANGQNFVVLTYAQRSGSFATINVPDAGALELAPQYNPENLTLNVRPRTFSISDVTVVEGNSGSTNLDFIVSLSSPATQTITVQYATQNGTATAPADYTAASSTLTFSAGQISKTISIAVQGDTLDESNEKFNLNLSNATGLAIISDNQGSGTINDNDASPSISINDVSVTETNGGSTQAQITLTLSAPSGLPISVLAQSSSSAGSPAATVEVDYLSAPAATVTFAPGQTTKTFNVTILGDVIDENDEKFAVSLSSPANASIGDNTGVVTILDNDNPPTVSVSAPNSGEGDPGDTATMTFTIKLSAASARNISVQYQTANASTFPATSSTDYTAVPLTTVIFAPGETTKTVDVTVKGDTLDEDNERIKLNLQNPVNATLGTISEGIIVDDDATPSLSINDLSVNEGNSGTKLMTFTVTLSTASGRSITVNAATGNGGSPAATAGSDYVALASTPITFTPGQTSKQVGVTISGDTTVEQNEKLAVVLSGAVNATLADNSGIGTIINDDASGLTAPTITPAGNDPS